jgi:hypothetical protein
MFGWPQLAASFVGASHAALQNSRLLDHASEVRDRLSLMIEGLGSLGCRIFGMLRLVRIVRKRGAMRPKRNGPSAGCALRPSLFSLLEAAGRLRQPSLRSHSARWRCPFLTTSPNFFAFSPT